MADGDGLLDDDDTLDDLISAPAKEQAAARPFLLALEPAGFAVAPLYSYGAAVAYSPEGRWWLGAEYLRGVGSLFNRRVIANMVEVKAKLELIAGLHAGVGLATRSVKGQVPAGDVVAPAGVPYSTGKDVSVMVLGGEGFVGSAWRSGRIEVACDWAGTFQPWRTVAQSGDTGGGTTPDDGRFDRLAHRHSLQILRFSLGVRI